MRLRNALYLEDETIEKTQVVGYYCVSLLEQYCAPFHGGSTCPGLSGSSRGGRVSSSTMYRMEFAIPTTNCKYIIVMNDNKGILLGPQI